VSKGHDVVIAVAALTVIRPLRRTTGGECSTRCTHNSSTEPGEMTQRRRLADAGECCALEDFDLVDIHGRQ
jgi:hypothetical protein